MTPEEAAYQKGYRAGRARLKRDSEDARWNAAFVAILPSAMLCQNWQFGAKPIISTDDRLRLACIWADKATGMMK